ncbi:GNAT family N-acetyltransferase [Aestuariivirga sp.]|uniref:GNAT family N-acetyltransferase n=1 Tax=Aestuariivirga sp. TaxID=2650926 RepID=UPI0035933515
MIDHIELRQGEEPGFHEAGDERHDWLTPFQSARWVQSWQDRVGSMTRFKPVTAICHGAGQPVLKLPLAVVRRFGANILTWSAYPQSDYTAPIVSRAHMANLQRLDGARIMREIAARIGGIDLIYMPKQPGLIGTVPNPFVLPGAVPYHVGAHAINFRPGESWEESLKRRRSGKTLKRLREKRAALEKLGPVRFRIAATEAEARRMIDSCLTAKTDQLQKLGHWDPFSPPGVRDFLVSFFSSNIGHSTWAISLEVDGKPAATAFGFRDHEQWLLYQMSMPSGPEARQSPGTHMLMDLMRHCIAQGVQRLDLALGDESYKAEWCDEHISLNISTLAFTARGHVLDKLVRMRTSLRSRMASDAKLYERAKWVKGLARKLHLPV